MRKISQFIFTYIWLFIERFDIDTKHAPYIFGKAIGATHWEEVK